MPAALALFIGLALSVGFFAIVSSLRERRIEEEFNRRANSMLAFVGEGINAHFETLYAVRDLFRASDRVDYDTFTRFVEDPLARHPALRSLSWAPTVSDANRTRFEDAISAILGRPYEIRVALSDGGSAPSPDRAEYTPIAFISPMARGETVLGIDLQSSPQRRTALEQARQTRALTTTPWLELTGGGLGILAILPPFPEDQPPSATLSFVQAGVVVGTIEIEDLIAVTAGQLANRVDFFVFDESPYGTEGVSYHYDGAQDRVVPISAGEAIPRARPGPSLRTTLEVGGQRWGFHFFPSAGFLQAQQTTEPWLASGAGVILTLLFTVYLLLSIRRTEQMEEVNRALETEVSERERIQSMLRQRDNAHRFLAEASSILVSSLDYEETLRRIAHLAVPDITEWCVVHVLEPSGELRRVEVVGADADLADRVRGMLAREPEPVSAADNMVTRALRTGESQVSDDPTGEMLRSVEDEEVRGYLREVAPRHALSIPLVARDRTLGALTFLTTDPTGFGPRDRELLEELARRAALHVDNARLFEDAQAASQSKSDFLAIMSHELRTPLNAIMGYADLLLMGVPEEPSEEQSRQLERINASARHLLDLIEEILTYSRTEAGHEEVHTERLALDELIDDLLDGARRSAATKGLELEAQLPDEPIELVTDPAKVRQILANLLSNAIKFTNEGTMGLRVHTHRDDVVIEVWDMGIGIKEAQRAQMFEPFWQAEDPTTRTEGGTGLGLTVSRRLARLIGGDLEVTSEAGVGSTFSLTLPYVFEPVRSSVPSDNTKRRPQ